MTRRPIDPAVAPLLAKLEVIGGADDTRPAEQVLAEIEQYAGELAATLEPKRRAAKVKETAAELERLRASIVESGSLEQIGGFREAVAAHRRALGIPDPKPPRKRFGLADALEDRPPPPTVCRKLEWEVGRPPMIVGAPGAGKTFVIQAAALDMMLGRSLWGCPDFRVPKPLRVLQVDLDQGANKTLRRYKRLLRGAGVDTANESAARWQLAELADLHPDELGAYDVDTGEGLVLASLEAAELARWRAAWIDALRGYDVAFVDSLRRLAPFLDENDSRFSLVPDSFRIISEASGCVTILLHHASNKARPAAHGKSMPAVVATRGSSAIDGAAGAQLTIEASDKDLYRVAMARAGEAAKIPAFFLEFEDDAVDGQGPKALRVVYRTAEQAREPEKEAKLQRLRAAGEAALGHIREVNLRRGYGPTRTQVVQSVKGNDKALYAALDMLTKEGELREEKDGKLVRLWAADVSPKG